MSEESATDKVLEQHLQLVVSHLEYTEKAKGELWNRLAREELSTIVCAYCGHKTARDDKMALFDHIMTCEKRPEKTLLAKAFEVEDKLYARIIHLTTHQYLPDTCDECREILETLKRYTEAE